MLSHIVSSDKIHLAFLGDLEDERGWQRFLHDDVLALHDDDLLNAS